MDDELSVVEPAVDRWSEEASSPKKKRPGLYPVFFSLSGGVMRDKSGAGNRIDYLLAKMLESSDSLYVPNIDRNLDCLLTSLQLEMVNPSRRPEIPRQSEENLTETSDL